MKRSVSNNMAIYIADENMYRANSYTLRKYWELYTHSQLRSSRTSMSHSHTGTALVVLAVIVKEPSVRVREISCPDVMARLSCSRSLGDNKLTIIAAYHTAPDGDPGTAQGTGSAPLSLRLPL